MPDESKQFKTTLTIVVYLDAYDDYEARELVRSTSNWDDWNLLSIDKVVEVDE